METGSENSTTQELNKTRGKWTPLNIISVILGIVIFWPVGLFLLVWVLMDRDVTEIAKMVWEECRHLWAKIPGPKGTTNNRVFDEFQQTQMDRIKEIKKEVNERREAFSSYKVERDRKTEQNEFEAFMSKKPGAKEDSSPTE